MHVYMCFDNMSVSMNMNVGIAMNMATSKDMCKYAYMYTAAHRPGNTQGGKPAPRRPCWPNGGCLAAALRPHQRRRGQHKGHPGACGLELSAVCTDAAGINVGACKNQHVDHLALNAVCTDAARIAIHKSGTNMRGFFLGT